jgi:NAD(P)-dependent dehydrogenase (short-subunit alcohol dehydrogenase family)
MNPYSGRTAYIVGGSSGIGLAVAGELARRGTHLCLLARRPDVLEQARLQVRSLALLPGQRVRDTTLDVTEHGLTQKVLGQVARDWGRPDLVINCAGRAMPRQFAQITPEQFAETLRLNLQGAFNLAAAASPLMQAGGHLVNVASLAGLLGVYGYSDYCAAKFGLVGFSAALRCEMAPLGIKVSVLCPGDTDTPGYRQEDKHKPALTRALSAHGGLLRPEQVAKALLAGLARNKFLIVPGLRAKLIVAAQRHLPGLVWWVMRRDLRKASARLGSLD